MRAIFRERRGARASESRAIAQVMHRVPGMKSLDKDEREEEAEDPLSYERELRVQTGEHKGLEEWHHRTAHAPHKAVHPPPGGRKPGYGTVDSQGVDKPHRRADGSVSHANVAKSHGERGVADIAEEVRVFEEERAGIEQPRGKADKAES